MKETPWYDDDIFWQKMAPTMFSPSRIEAAKEEVTLLIGLLDIKPHESILDLSCGIGRHSNELARRGYKVTGVDRAPYFLKTAKETAHNEKLSVEFILDDMRNFRRENAYDVVLSMYTSFGYFENPPEQEMVLQNILVSLKSGGRFIMETMGKEVLARIFKNCSVDIGDFGVVVTKRQTIDDWSKMRNQLIFVDPNNVVYQTEITHHLYSATEFKSLLVANGFSKAAAFGGLDGSEYDETAQRLVCVGLK